MLAKLCKYEFKSIGRSLLPLYVAVLGASVIAGLMGMNVFQRLAASSNFLSELLYMIINIVYFVLIVALFVSTLLIIIQRFYKGLLSDEGYLMFTLPVRPWQLITAKGLVATIMGILSIVVALISIIILASFYGGITLPSFQDLSEFITMLSRFTPTWPLLVIEVIVLLLLSAVAIPATLYTAMSVGHLAKRHRVALSFAAYIGISTIMSYVAGIVMYAGDQTPLGDLFTNINSPVTIMHVLFCGLIVWELLSLAFHFVVTNLILSRKLNLE